MVSEALQPELRRASSDDFQFWLVAYRDLMKPLTTELLEWTKFGQRRVIEQALADSGTSIIVVRNSDIGWLQTRETRQELYLGSSTSYHRCRTAASAPRSCEGCAIGPTAKVRRSALR